MREADILLVRRHALEAAPRFLEALRSHRRGPSSGSLAQYADRILGGDPDLAWDTVLWWRGSTLVAAATCEPWYRIGGPAPYHDSYTTSVFVEPTMTEAVLEALVRTVHASGRRTDTLLR